MPFLLTPLHYFLLAVPILFADWQIALVWVIGCTQPTVINYLDDLPFQGFEVALMFVFVGLARTFIFRR